MPQVLSDLRSVYKFTCISCQATYYGKTSCHFTVRCRERQFTHPHLRLTSKITRYICAFSSPFWIPVLFHLNSPLFPSYHSDLSPFPFLSLALFASLSSPQFVSTCWIALCLVIIYRGFIHLCTLVFCSHLLAEDGTSTSRNVLIIVINWSCQIKMDVSMKWN